MNLSIRTKVFIMVIVGVAALTGIIYAISSTILLGSYVDIEREEAVKNVQRVDDAISDLVRTLDVAASDWAAWDDPYTYMEGTNPAFEETDLTELAMSNLEINTMLFVNTQHGIVFDKSFNLATGGAVVSEGLSSYIRTREVLLQNVLANGSRSGLANTPEGPLAVVMHPIVHSDGSGPPAGVLIFSKFLNDAIVQSLEELTHLSITLHPYDSNALPDDVAKARALLTDQNPHFAEPLDDDVMAAYTVLYDLENAPFLILRVTTARPVYQQGLAALRVFVGMAGATSIFFGLVFVVLLERLVISRLAGLELEVGRIRDSHDTSAQVAEGASDELGRLAREINSMLKALAASDAEEREAHEKIRAADSELKKHIEEIEKMNAHMVDRELKMVELKKENEELRTARSKAV